MEQLLSLQPPPHVMPDFVNPPSQRGVNLACNILCLTVATLCVLIRLHTKIFIQKSPGWDDRKQHPSMIGMGRLILSRCLLYRLGRSNQYFNTSGQHLLSLSMQLGLVIYASLLLVLNPVAGVHQWDIEPNNLQIWIKVSFTFYIPRMKCSATTVSCSLAFLIILQCDVQQTSRPFH